jgi:hypothetical protein
MPGPAADRLTELAAGLLPGLAAVLVCLWAGGGRREGPPLAGLALAAATAVGLAVTGAPADPALGWPALAAIAAAVAAALAAFDRRWRDLGLLPALLAVAAAGIWVCVPDVEGALVLLGATLSLTLLGWPSPLAAGRPGLAGFGVGGSAAVAAVVVWVVASGGAGRPGSVVGGLACLGLVLVEPAVRLLDRHRRSPLDPLDGRPRLAWAALAVQLVLAGFAARVAGRPEGTAPALGLAALGLGAALAAGAVLARRPPAGRRPAP